MSVNTVQHCSMEQMVLTLEALANDQFINNDWLPNSNRYKRDIIEKIKDDAKPGNSINHNDLREYTAVSSILHCTDGWTFLSRALKSLISGDVPSAMFFIYYSELRALMSLFSTNGISVLNNKHYYFKNDGNAYLNQDGGTHIVVQKILKEYAKNTSKSIIMLKWIKVGNKSIEEWVGSSGQHGAYIMDDFLSHWGLDINEVRKDRDTRNKVSYRPHFLEPEAFSYSYKEYVSKIAELWRLCEPVGSDFGQLDLYILKMSLKKVFDNSTYGNGQKFNIDRENDDSYRNDFKDYISQLNANLGSPLLEYQLKILTSFDTAFDQFLDKANKKAYDEVTNKYDPIPMLARAIFLLRFATAGVDYLLSSADISKDDIKFWWEKYGNKYGFWEQDDVPDNFVDSLWPDIEDIINDINEAITNNNEFNGPKSLDNLSLAQIHCFTQLNKIPLWGFGI